MDRLDLVKFFKDNLDITLTPAGVWRLHQIPLKNEYIKTPVNAGRTDYLKWDKYNGDNMSRLKLVDTPYIVIDVDGVLENPITDIFSKAEDTFYSTTTAPHKRHYYFLPPEGYKKPLLTKIQWNGLNVDILSTGVLFEGHGVGISTTTGCYDTNFNEVQRLTKGEYELLVAESEKINYDNKRMATYYHNVPLTRAVNAYVANGKCSTRQWNLIVKCIFPDIVNPEPKKRLCIQGLAKYNMFNKCAFLLHYNRSLDTKVARKFLHILLDKELGVNSKSVKWQKRLYKNILPTLPTHNSSLESDSFDSIIDRLDAVTMMDMTFIKCLLNKQMVYIILDPETLKIRLYDYDIYVNKITLADILKMSTKEFNDFNLSIPMVKIVNLPHQEFIYYDEDNHIDCYNIAEKSVYQERSVVCSEIDPDNILRKVIESYCGVSNAPLYYAWLARVIFNPTPPSMMFIACSPAGMKAGTGKSTLSASIPFNLLKTAKSVDEATIEASWGDTFGGGSTLICINDGQSDDVWKRIYPTLRDETTPNLLKERNYKYSGFIKKVSNVSVSYSCNFVPSIDDHDRRCWIVLPAFLYGDGNPLSDVDSRRLRKLIEQTSLNTYKPEFQELINYLKWVESQQWFEDELTHTAPHTLGRSKAINNGKGYGLQLVGLLRTNIKELLMMTDFKSISGSTFDYPLRDNKSFVAFLKMQLRGDTLYLPYKFLSNLLASVQQGKPKTTPKAVALALGLETSDYRECLCKQYTNDDVLRRFNIPSGVKNWSGEFSVELKVSDSMIKYIQNR